MLLFVGHLVDCACACCVRVVVGVVLFENCIVDASIFFILCNFVESSLFVLVLSVKGARWMPWHNEPMKDVRGCEMPRGVAN